MVYKMIVLLCSLATTPDLKDCTEANAIAVNHMTRIAPSADRCDHDSQHEQAQLLYRTGLAPGEKGAPHRKIKVLCIPSP
jgi:hypothetical protein